MHNADLGTEGAGELREVFVCEADMYAIETAVLAAIPAVFDTGTDEEFARFLEHDGTPHAYILYDRTEHKVGYLALSALSDAVTMEVRSIAVLPEYQHAGYGMYMMRAAEAMAQQAGRNKMTLVTSPQNERAVHFYKSLGYVVVDTVENYYGDGTPRFILEKQLGA